MSKIEVDTIEPQSGTSLTLGASGDTITIPSGAVFDINGIDFPTTDGTAGQVLQTDGSGNLSFATPSGGKVLQVVTTANGTVFSTTSASYVDAISASITPSSASNKILIMGHTGALDTTTASNVIGVSIFRDAIDLASATFFAITRYESANVTGNLTLNHLDSPNTTSSITYTFKFRKESGGGTVFFNNNGSNRMILMEISA